MLDLIKVLADALANTEDLGRVDRALARERAIRAAMARTGEGRVPVAEMIDAMDSMSQEAVLDLTEGEPTTLIGVLRRYIDTLRLPGMHQDTVAAELTALLDYPWPVEEERLASHGLNQSLQLHVEHPDDPDGGGVSVAIGSNRWEIYRTKTHGEAGLAVGEAVEEVARAVYRAVLARVIGDREHSVQINAGEASSLIAWAVNSSGGSWSPGVSSRLDVRAVAGGGWLVRTRPYAYQYQVNEERRRMEREAQVRTWGASEHAIVADGGWCVPAEDATVIPPDQVTRALYKQD